MKKLVYLLAVSFGASMFAACGSSDQAKNDADSAVVEEVAVEEIVPVDSAAADTVVAAADSAVVK